MNSADEANDVFNELMIKEMQIFNKLMNKKIKIDSRITLESIINFLKSNGIHTAYLERQKEVHSIFFISENETSFLPIKEISDREFNESSLEEVSIDEFIDIINADANVNMVSVEDNIIDNTINNKFIKIKTIEDSTYVINIDKIDYCKLHHNNLITVVNNSILELDINNNENKKFLKILGV